MRSVTDKIVDKIKTRFRQNKFSEHRAVYEIMWEKKYEVGHR